MSTELEGAKSPGDRMAESANAGEFAARWNAASEEQREMALRGIKGLTRDGATCLEMDHRAHIDHLESQIARLRSGGSIPPELRAGVLHISTAPDMETRAELFNEGYEAAMAQHLADDPTAAEDWLAKHDDLIRAEALDLAASIVRVAYDEPWTDSEQVARVALSKALDRIEASAAERREAAGS